MGTNIWQQGLTVVETVQRDPLGSIRWEANKAYKYVNYVGGSGAVDAVAFDAVFYTNDTGYAANEVMQDLTDISVTPITAGIVGQAIDISEFANGAFIWLQIKGHVAALAIAIETSNDGTPAVAADGDSLIYGDADGALRKTNDVIDAAGERGNICGIAVDATAKEILVDCPY